MNKTVSINLGGIFFHIEEDAYTRLEGYLDSINRHFANEEGADEILEDIEARVAEMFQETLSQSKRQVILPTDVNQMIGVMGLPDQFDEPEVGHTQAHSYEQTHKHEGNNSKTDIPKGERASNRKKSRRLYRNPDEAFMGGVCAGLSDYFGIEDPIWIRLAFAVSFFTGGWGVFPYILLWAIVPEAKTPAQKLAMKGEPINVSNIEKIVKEGMDNLKNTIEDFSKSENGKKTKFFFKQATVEVKKSAPKAFKVGGKVLKGFLIFLGIVMLISLGTALIAIIGSLLAFSKFFVTFVFSSSMPLALVSISTFFLIGIPIIFISYAVLRRSFNVRVQSASWARGLGFLWVLSLISLIAVGGTTYDKNFSSRSTTIIPAERLEVNAQTLHLKVLENDYYDKLRTGHHKGHHRHNGGMDIDMSLPDMRFDEVIFDSQSKAIYVEKVQLDVEKSESDDFEIIKTISSRGGSTQSAQQIAEKINHEMVLQDESLFVSPYYKIDHSDKWRFQRYHITLKVPVGKAVYFDEATYGDEYKVIYDVKNVTNTYDGDMVGKTWLMTEKGLKEWKIDVMEENEFEGEETIEETEATYSVSPKSLNDDAFSIPSILATDHTKNFNFSDFTELDIAGSFNVYVQQGNDFNVTLVSHEGDNKLDKASVQQDGNTLEVSMNSKWSFFSKSNNGEKLDLHLTMPELTEIELTGTSHAIIKDFNQEDISFEISGASHCNASVQLDKLVADMSGAGNLNLKGTSQKMYLELSGASTLNAYDFITSETEAELSGASNAHIHVNNSLDADLSGASQMLYVGEPTEVRSETSGAAHITKVHIE